MPWDRLLLSFFERTCKSSNEILEKAPKDPDYKIEMESLKAIPLPEELLVRLNYKLARGECHYGT